MPSPNGQRECGCPPWVRCVHFDGKVLTLRDDFAAKALHDDDCRVQSWPHQYAVAIGADVRPARCGCNMDCFWNSQGHVSFDTLPAAEAEFRLREAAMLGREE